MRYSLFFVTILILIFSSTDKTNLFAQTSENDTTNNTWYFLVTPGSGLMKNSEDLTVYGIGFYLRRNHISFRYFGVFRLKTQQKGVA